MKLYGIYHGERDAGINGHTDLIDLPFFSTFGDIEESQRESVREAASALLASINGDKPNRTMFDDECGECGWRMQHIGQVYLKAERHIVPEHYVCNVCEKGEIL